MSASIDTKLENHIETYARLADAELRGVMETIAERATTVAKATLGTSGHADDSIHRGIHPLPVVHAGGVWETGVAAGDWKSNFFEKGTHAHSIEPKARRVYSLTKTGRKRRKRLKGDNTFVSGVEAYHYLRRGITVSSATLRALVGSRFSRIRV